MNPAQRHAWLSTQEALSSKDVSKQKKCMAMILRLKLSQREFQRRMRQLYDTDPVEGPEAVAWGLRIMATLCEPGPDRIFLLRFIYILEWGGQSASPRAENSLRGTGAAGGEPFSVCMYVCLSVRKPPFFCSRFLNENHNM